MGEAPRRWSMNRSVSTRMSATFPLIAIGGLGFRIGAEGGGEDRHGITLLLQVRVEGAAYDLGHCQTVGLSDRIDALPLLLGEIDLRADRRHTARLYSTRAATTHAAGHIPRVKLNPGPT